MLTMYVLLDGFDLGAGAINLSVAKSDRERRIVLHSIGPVWDGNEVWIIAAGGTLFFSFPLLYASSFSGFYLPLIIVLWLLMIRGLSIELRGHIESPVWASFWDGMFFLGSSLLAVFYGVALGNVVRGVPIGEDGFFFQPLWTDFSPFSANPGILDWYTILTGLLALTTLVVHGANWVALKTEAELNARARRAARIGWVALVSLTGLTTVATFSLSPEMLSSFAERPWGVVFPALAVAGLALMGYFGFRRRQGRLPIVRCLHRGHDGFHRLRHLPQRPARRGAGEQPDRLQRLRLGLRARRRPRVVEHRYGARGDLLRTHLPSLPWQGELGR